MPFPIGAVKIAAVLSGTSAAWTSGHGIGELAVFGSLNATQERIRDVIKVMLTDGLIAQEGSYRPTIGLTPEGRQELNLASTKPVPETQNLSDF